MTKNFLRHRDQTGSFAGDRIARKLFPPVEAELMGRILARDAEFYRPSILIETIKEMNRFANAVGLLSSPVP